MKVAILNPGPSLNATYPGREGYDLTIGVNRTMLAYHLDWWVWMDCSPAMPCRVWNAPDSEWLRPKPDKAPNQFTTDTGARYLEDHDLPRRDVWQFHEYQQVIPYVLKWHVFSATAAIALAYLLGATHADVYGANMEGLEDFDGTTCTQDTRDERRWNRERTMWNDTVAWMAFQGMAVRRIVPAALYHNPQPEARINGAA